MARLRISMKRLAGKFSEQYGLEAFHFDHLGTLEEIDDFMLKLKLISGKEVPERFKRERRHLQDHLLDVENYFYHKKAMICGDPELIRRWEAPLNAMDVETIPACGFQTKKYQETDLTDVEKACESHACDILIGNTHAAKLGEKHGLSVVRTGIPVEDRVGEPQRVRVGYKGAVNLFHDCTNALLKTHRHRE